MMVKLKNLQSCSHIATSTLQSFLLSDGKLCATAELVRTTIDCAYFDVIYNPTHLSLETR
jgi:hypothetical protein